MMSAITASSGRRFKAPSRHGELLIDPSLPAAAEVFANNVQRIGGFQYSMQGRQLSELLLQARHDLISAARRYTDAYAEDSAALEHLPVISAGESPLPPIILAGHQPQLFHAGVWTKNFVLGRVAQSIGALPINLIIDNDLVRSPSIRVPTKSDQQPAVETVLYDQVVDPAPYEERTVLNWELFASFGERVERALRPWLRDPLIQELWPAATRAVHDGRPLGQALALARHRLEMRWGLTNLEVPLAEVCDGEAFRWFTAHVLADLPRFWATHNDALAEYRRRHRLRSHSHPVPTLAKVDEWFEAPFWVWHADRPQRRRLLVRASGDICELSDRHGWSRSLPLCESSDGAAAVQRLGEWAAEGVKIRPRALITTMYARLFLSDLFLHGIGGAKYDELTDVLIQRFFGLEPPAFMVVSGSFYLPLLSSRVEPADLRQLDQHLRELRFQPDRHVPPAMLDGSASRLIEEKCRLVQQEPPRSQRRARHQAIESINARLQPLVAEQRALLENERRRVGRLLREQSLLGSREFSFCLFPEQTLQPYLLELFSRED